MVPAEQWEIKILEVTGKMDMKNVSLFLFEVKPPALVRQSP